MYHRSAKNLIEAGLKGLGVRDRFSSIYSAADEKFGKPHPAVYLRWVNKCSGCMLVYTSSKMKM